MVRYTFVSTHYNVRLMEGRREGGVNLFGALQLSTVDPNLLLSVRSVHTAPPAGSSYSQSTASQAIDSQKEPFSVLSYFSSPPRLFHIDMI
jgi:hypothetical protein